MLAHRTPDSAGVVPLVKRVVDNVEHLVSTHLELIRIELKEDAGTLARQIGSVLACAPLIVSGLIIGLAGGALLLAAKTVIPAWGAFLIVGGGTMLIGGIALAAVIRNLRKPALLDDSAVELRRSTDVVSDLVANGADDVH